MPPTDTFAERLGMGNAAARRLKDILEGHGLTVASTGQERLLGALHKLIRFKYDATAKFAKHVPDMLCACPNLEPFYAEAKSTFNEYWEGPNFSIETASLEVCQFLDGAGIRVAIFFENEFSVFRAAWAKDINPFREIKKMGRTSGSLIRKDTLLPLDNFLAAYQKGESHV